MNCDAMFIHGWCIAFLGSLVEEQHHPYCNVIRSPTVPSEVEEKTMVWVPSRVVGWETLGIRAVGIKGPNLHSTVMYSIVQYSTSYDFMDDIHTWKHQCRPKPTLKSLNVFNFGIWEGLEHVQPRMTVDIRVDCKNQWCLWPRRAKA